MGGRTLGTSFLRSLSCAPQSALPCFTCALVPLPPLTPLCLPSPLLDLGLWVLRGKCVGAAVVCPLPPLPACTARYHHLWTTCRGHPHYGPHVCGQHHTMDPTFWGLAPLLGNGHCGPTALVCGLRSRWHLCPAGEPLLVGPAGHN